MTASASTGRDRRALRRQTDRMPAARAPIMLRIFMIACLAPGMMGLGGFRAGQIITTGSLITPLKPTKPMAIHAELAGIGAVDVAIG